MKRLIRQLCPPILVEGARRLRHAFKANHRAAETGESQDLELYWDPRMAEILESWGEGNAWNEIQLLMADRRGKVLDIACGTGKVMELLQRFKNLELHGCDISDLLIDRALKRGIPQERLNVLDATAMTYATGAFDFGYSIGSLEHFTEGGIAKFMAECARVVKGPTFHMVPMSRSGRNEGWLKTMQSFHNNNEDWWRSKCRAAYASVEILGSSWSDDISVGRWLICGKH